MELEDLPFDKDLQAHVMNTVENSEEVATEIAQIIESGYRTYEQVLDTAAKVMLSKKLAKLSTDIEDE